MDSQYPTYYATSQLESGIPVSYPLDSTQIMMGILELSRIGEAGRNQSDLTSLDGVIAKRLLRDLLAALHIRDLNTINHVRRVAQLVVGMGQNLGWDGRELRRLEVAALLHDVGKIGVPDNLLRKPGRFSPDEIELMSLQTNVGICVLQACRVDLHVIDMIKQAHHLCHGAAEGATRFSKEYLLGARILAVADAYDSLISPQPYRPAKKHEDAIEILYHEPGSQFDSVIVQALDRWVRKEGISTHRDENYQDFERQFSPNDLIESQQAAALCNIFTYLYLQENLYHAYYILDADLKYIVWNNGAEELFGKPAREVLWQSWSSRVLTFTDNYEDPLEEADYPIRRVLNTGKPVVEALKIHNAEEQLTRIEVQSLPIKDRNGSLLGVLELFSDHEHSRQNSSRYKQLKIRASHDPLTNVANRGEMENQLASQMSNFKSDPQHHPLSVIFMDIDHFKPINDTYGHSVGDQVLIDVARLLKQQTYSGELVARYGGEEFVIICPETKLDQAYARAERIRSILAKETIGQEAKLRVTASFGVSTAEEGDSILSLLRRADQAVYLSKQEGRNRSTILTSEIIAEREREEQEKERQKSPYEFVSQLEAVVGADMIVYKLSGFVEAHDAKLLKVEEGKAVIRVGEPSFWDRLWGADGRAIQITITFQKSTKMEARRPMQQTEVTVRMVPIGWKSKDDTFQKKARDLFRDLRSYFAAK